MTESKPRRLFYAWTTTRADTPLQIYAEGWKTDGETGAMFYNGSRADAEVVAIIRSGFLVSVQSAESLRRAPGEEPA